MRFQEQLFTDERINLDDNVFIACKFERCVIVFKGLGSVTLKNSKFVNCTYSAEGPAGTTLALLRMLYAEGWADVIETTFETIRTPPEEGT